MLSEQHITSPKSSFLRSSLSTPVWSDDGGATWQRSFRAVRGSNMVRVRQVDVAGNVSLPAVVQFTLERP